MSISGKIGIIGAGPSGMTAALQAAWAGAQVVLFDSNPQVGRKLLVTGSGRCNLTNQAAAAEKYTCADPNFMRALLARFGQNELLAFLKKIGVLTFATPDGWYYPISESAQTVVEAFSAALEQAGVEIRLSTPISHFSARPNHFELHSPSFNEKSGQIFKRLILAAGGKAYPTLGSRGELFPSLEKCGHTLQTLYPALGPVLADNRLFQTLQGVRLDVEATLWEGKTQLAQTRGNLIVTQWGFNGPAVMDLSHQIANRPDARLELSLNLIAFHESALLELIAQKRNSAVPLRVLLNAVLPPKVPILYLQMAGLPLDIPAQKVSDQALNNVLAQLRDTRFPIKGVRGFEYCQLSSGGVPVTEADPDSMQSLKIPGLYLAGETLDVVGPCGGYNLQYAFSSGAVAGLSAAASLNKE